MKRIFTTASLCVFFSVSTANVVSAATRQELISAQQMMQTGQYSQALVSLEAVHNPADASTQEYFLLGLAAKLSGSLKKAEGYFAAALKKEPNAGRIRLEIAEVQYRLGKFDAAKRQMEAVLQLQPPEPVRSNVLRYIAQIDEAQLRPQPTSVAERKNWNAYVSFGVTSDSNVNAGPSTDTVFLYGLPFTLSSSAQATSDVMYSLRLGLNHAAPLDDGVVWRSSANLSLSKHQTATAYNTGSISLSSGPAFQFSENLGLTFPITYSGLRYTDQGSWYSQSVGLSPTLQLRLSEKMQANIATSISKKRFNGQSSRDLTAYTLNPSFNFQPYSSGNWAAGFQFGHENSGQDIYSNAVRGIYIGYQHSFPEQKMQASVTVSYTDTKFEGIQPAYTVARHDVSRKIAASLSYQVPQVEGLTVRGNVSYQDNESNLPINTYERTQLSLSITKSF